MATVYLPFGERSGELLHISEVENGLACNCVCCSCGEKLVAKKGDERTHHFAHYQTETCNKALETSLHKAAKRIFYEEQKITLPDFIDFEKQKTLKFNRVESEKAFSTGNQKIVADIVGYYNDCEPFIIEIAVTNYSGERKRKVLRKLGVPSVEIYLSEWVTDFNTIKNRLVTETTSKHWIYHPLQDKPEVLKPVMEFQRKCENQKIYLAKLAKENTYLKNEVENYKITLRNYQGDEGYTTGDVGRGWGPKLGRPINLSVSKEELLAAKTDFYGNIRLKVLNKKEIDQKTKINLVVFLDDYPFKKAKSP